MSIGQGMHCTQASHPLVLARVPLILPLFTTPLNTTASKTSKEATGPKEVRRCNIFGGKRLLGYTESSHHQQAAVFMHNNPPRYLHPSCVSMAHTKIHTHPAPVAWVKEEDAHRRCGKQSRNRHSIECKHAEYRCLVAFGS